MIVGRDAPLSDVLRYRIGGRARFLVDAQSPDDVRQAVSFVREHSVESVLFVGHGANLLFPDDYFDGAVIRLVDPVQPQGAVAEGEEGLIKSYAGETLDRLIQRAFDSGLVGLEWAGGLPGTVGAAVRGNVGAFGGEVKDWVRDVTVLDIADDAPHVLTLRRDELDFVYRGSLLKQKRNLIALGASFCLRRGSAADLARARDTYRANIAYREARHPMDYPNTGSTFKNIAAPDEVARVLAVFPDLTERVLGDWHGKVSMGFLNRRLGFSGYRVGNAEVSEKHCNFVLNLGGARARDVAGIIGTIQQRFEDTFGFRPEPEVEIVREPAREGG